MTEFEKDYKYNKAKEWFDRPAYYVREKRQLTREELKQIFYINKKGRQIGG